MEKKKYMIQGCLLSGEIAYTVFTNDIEEMKTEVVNGLNRGYIMQVGMLQDYGGKND